MDLRRLITPERSDVGRLALALACIGFVVWFASSISSVWQHGEAYVVVLGGKELSEEKISKLLSDMRTNSFRRRMLAEKLEARGYNATPIYDVHGRALLEAAGSGLLHILVPFFGVHFAAWILLGTSNGHQCSLDWTTESRKAAAVGVMALCAAVVLEATVFPRWDAQDITVVSLCCAGAYIAYRCFRNLRPQQDNDESQSDRHG